MAVKLTVGCLGMTFQNPVLVASGTFGYGDEYYEIMPFSRLGGLVAISQGFILVCMIWAAASTCLIERKFDRAAAWAAIGALSSFFGFIHAGHLTPAGGVYDIGVATGWPWSVGYLMCAAFFGLMHLWRGRQTTAPHA